MNLSRFLSTPFSATRPVRPSVLAASCSPRLVTGPHIGSLTGPHDLDGGLSVWRVNARQPLVVGNGEPSIRIAKMEM
jgi:hypothetical protein